LPADWDWSDPHRLNEALKTLTRALRPWTIDFHVAQNDATVKGSGTHDKTGHHCLPNDPDGKLRIAHHAGYWLHGDDGKLTKAFRHICWDGCMFPNAVMSKPETWNDILASMIAVRDAHGWREDEDEMEEEGAAIELAVVESAPRAATKPKPATAVKRKTPPAAKKPVKAKPRSAAKPAKRVVKTPARKAASKGAKASPRKLAARAKPKARSRKPAPKTKKSPRRSKPKVELHVRKKKKIGLRARKKK